MAITARSLPAGRLAVTVVLLATFGVSQSATAAGRLSSGRIGSNGQGTVLFVGDSLTVGTTAFGKMTDRIKATNLWTKVVVDAKVGRKASLAPGILDARLGKYTTAIVIALGINDMISRPEPWYPSWVIDKVMARTRGLPVLWVNLEFSSSGRRDWVSRASRFNRVLRKAQAKWPNLQIADWNSAFTPVGASRFIADGVHLTVSGYKTRSTFCVRSVADFGRAVINATTTTTTTPPDTTTTTTSTTTTTLS